MSFFFENLNVAKKLGELSRLARHRYRLGVRSGGDCTSLFFLVLLSLFVCVTPSTRHICAVHLFSA